MAFQKLDKKQVPQVAALAILACGAVGYGAKQMFVTAPASANTAVQTPAPDNAGARHIPASPVLGVGGPTKAVPLPPAPTMRDPFQATVNDHPDTANTMVPSAAKTAPKAAALETTPHVASLPLAPFGMAGVRPLPSVSGTAGVSVPFAPPLPGQAAASVANAPAAAPTWTVTGVLASGTEHIAVLRSGTERRFVRQGEWADSQFQVVRVERSSVTLKHGTQNYTLPLGGKDAPAQSAAPDSGGARIAPARETTPAAVSAVPKPIAPPTLTITPRTWAVAKSAPRANLVRATVAAPRLALQTPALPTVKPIVKPTVKPIVKVAAFHAESMAKAVTKSTAMKSAVPPGMLALGTPAPDFVLRTLNGTAVSLSQMLSAGRPAVLTFWASWVAPCASAMPQMAEVAQSAGASFLPVGSWDSHAALASFAAAHSMDTRTILCDDSVPNQSVAVRLYRAPDVPTCYVLDGRGRVAAAFVGFNAQTAGAVRAALLRLKSQ